MKKGKVNRIRKMFYLMLGGLLLLLSGPILYLLINYEEWTSANWRTAGRGPVEGRLEKHYMDKAMVMVFSARAFGSRGAFGSHPWIAFKSAESPEFSIAEVIGWRLRWDTSVINFSSGYPDRMWFGRVPEILFKVEDDKAEAMIPQIEKAIQDYPYAGEYRVWPGPNSNTFLEYIRGKVPQLDFAMPSLSLGQDYGKLLHVDMERKEFTLSLFGYFGWSIGYRQGVRLHVLGFQFGFHPFEGVIYYPGFGDLKLFS